MESTENIEILKFLKIEYAHRHSAENYSYSLSTAATKQPDKDIITGIMEIGYVEENPLVFVCDDQSEFCAFEGDIFILLPNSHFSVHTKNNGLHRHITTEALIECRIGENTDGVSSLNLPRIIKSNNQSEKIKSQIRRITRHHTTVSQDDFFRHCADYMTLLSNISSYLTKSMLPPSIIVYCDKAKKYISENISSDISVKDIANEIGISKNYLTNIFSECEKMPITEYINRIKLRHVTELMFRFGYGIREAGEYAGYTNPNYVSRIFRKYFGVTITEYLKNMRRI